MFEPFLFTERQISWPLWPRAYSQYWNFSPHWFGQNNPYRKNIVLYWPYWRSPWSQGQRWCWCYDGFYGTGTPARHHYSISSHIHYVARSQHQYYWHTWACRFYSWSGTCLESPGRSCSSLVCSWWGPESDINCQQADETLQCSMSCIHQQTWQIGIQSLQSSRSDEVLSNQTLNT